MIDFKVLDMTMDHVDEVLVIERLSFKTPWSREAFVSELTRNKCSRYKVLIADNRAVAYAGLWVMLDEGHITNIAVHPDYRGFGLGNVLVEELIKVSRNENLTAMTLEVRVNNLPAINLYKKYGFKETAIRKGYYQDTKEDALIMWKYDIN